MMRESNSILNTKLLDRIALSVCLFLFSPLYTLTAQPLDALTSEETAQALVTIYVNGKRYGDQEVVVKGDNVHIPASFMAAALEPILDDGIFRLVQNLTWSDGFLNPVDMRFLGFTVDFDNDALALRVRVPPRFLRLNYLGPGVGQASVNAPAVDPSIFSAYVNSSFRAIQSNAEGESPSIAFSESMDGAVNLHGWVAEAAFTAEISQISSAELDYARIVRDFRSLPARLSAGTVDLPWTGFQSRIALLGLSFTRYEDAGLPGSVKRIEYRALTDTFVVESTAKVSVKLNGNSVFSTRVDAGRYRFSDLPYTSGVNEVEIEIAEKDKETISYNLGVPFDSGALRAGMFDYGAGAGFDVLNSSSPALSGYLSYGLFDTLNIGASVQAGYGTVLSGISLSSATGIGIFGLSGALSYDAASGSMDKAGYAADFTYRLAFANHRYYPRLGLKGTWQSPSFYPPVFARPALTPNAKWSASAQIVQATPFGLSFVFAGEFRNDGKNEGRDMYLSFGITSSLGRGVSLQTNASVHDRYSLITPSISLTLIIVPDGSQSSMIYRQNMISGESSADISVTKGKGPGSYSYTVSAEDLLAPGSSPAFVSGSVRRTGSLVDLSAALDIRDERSVNGKSASFTFGADNAASFVEGTFALSRRIGDSFVLLAPHASFGDAAVELRLGADRTEAKAGSAPRVAGLLSSYRDVVAEIDTPGSPPDVAAKAPRVLLRPIYKSALVVKPERTASAYVSGRLVDSSGSPLAWMYAAASDASDLVVGELFTDENGRFELYDLSEGSYRINWTSPGIDTTPFEIPAQANGNIDIGTIRGSVRQGGSQ